MLYELHLTAADGTDHDRWKHACSVLHIKPLLIELWNEDGRIRDQLMMAATHEGTDQSAADWQGDLTSKLIAGGFQISRSKLEVPLDKSAPYENPAYHEVHVKALLPKDILSTVVGKAMDAGWMASRNAFFTRDAGLEKWYFTQRSYPLPGGSKPGFIQAGCDFAEVYSDLATYNWHTVRMESETVLVDTNPSLDAEWA